MFRSDYNHPLVLQVTPSTATVTVENYIKWYALYVVDPSGQVHRHEFPTEIKGVTGSPFVDHVPNPSYVQAWAEQRGYELDPNSFEMIVGRWCIEVLETF